MTDPAPELIAFSSFEQLLEAHVRRLRALSPEATLAEADPATKLLEVTAAGDLTNLYRWNEDFRQAFLRHATGQHLTDHGIDWGIERRDEEEDDAFRDRLLTWIRRRHGAGTEDWYRAEILQAFPGVKEIFATRRRLGGVTNVVIAVQSRELEQVQLAESNDLDAMATLYGWPRIPGENDAVLRDRLIETVPLLPNATSPTLLGLIQEHFEGEGAATRRAVGDDLVFVSTGTHVAEISVTVTFSSGAARLTPATLETRLLTAITGAARLGWALSPAWIIGQLISIEGVQDVVVHTPAAIIRPDATDIIYPSPIAVVVE